MCLAVPVKVEALPSEGVATVTIEGIKLNVSSAFLTDLQIGEYVLVHAGFIIERLDTTEAEERIELIQEVYSKSQGDF
jgi:hydrogenase expression/formation protein HypC